MEEWVRRLEEAAELCRACGLPDGELVRAADEVRDYRVRVALLGAFNTGKSAFLNALLGTPLVHASLCEETALPTEVFFGPPRVTLVREGREVRSDPSVLRRGGPALEGAELARASLPLDSLAALPSLSLLDTPGIGTPWASRSGRLPGLVRGAGAYVLVFGADAPVVTETLAAFLAGLPLEGRPVLCVLTKCDQFSPRQIDRIAGVLDASLAGLPGLSAPRLCRVTCTGAPELGGAPEFLRQLQVRAGALAEARARQLLARGTAPLESYLTGRLQSQSLLEPELARAADELDRRLERLRAAADELRAGAGRLVLRAAAEGADRSRETLAPLAAPLADLLATGQDPCPFADGALRCVLRAEARSRLDPALESYCKALRRLASLHRVALPPRAAPGCEEAVDAAFAGTAALFAGQRPAPGQLVDALAALVQDALARGGAQALEQLEQALDRELYDPFASLRQALEDARRQQHAQAAAQRQTLERLQQDLDRLHRLTGCRKEECTHVV